MPALLQRKNAGTVVRNRNKKHSHIVIGVPLQNCFPKTAYPCTDRTGGLRVVYIGLMSVGSERLTHGCVQW